MEPNDRRFEKGFFSPIRFRVAEKYLRLSSRKRLFVAGAIAAGVFCVLFLADAFLGRAATIASGPLSESHAFFGKDCSTCHKAIAGVPNAKCESCHQKNGRDLAVYSFARHYEYQSGGSDRSAPHSSEASCGSCHREHKGRGASLQKVADAQCVNCHKIGSFGKGHPEFEFAKKKLADPANLHFPHVVHVREIMESSKLVDAEAACLQCHVPQPDGRSFQPITYARACRDCHLSSSTSTPFLPLRSGGNPGVSTLADIRRTGGPRARWADYWNSGEFNERGGEVQKRPVYHADPWVLFNLQKLRRDLYPGAELADLLNASAEVPARDARLLHQEAVKTLKDEIDALRGDPSPEVQQELASLNDLLKQVDQRLENPKAPLDETRFEVRTTDRATVPLNEAAYNTVIDSLTIRCQECHVVEKATIRRVQTDQRALVRAEFNHRAHVVHARCLDCHSTIPVRQLLASDKDAPAEADRAEILNLPTIKNCSACHTKRGAADRCTSCHVFHPDKSHWANLSR